MKMLKLVEIEIIGGKRYPKEVYLNPLLISRVTDGGGTAPLGRLSCVYLHGERDAAGDAVYLLVEGEQSSVAHKWAQAMGDGNERRPVPLEMVES